jgi:hypothetical protein
MRLLWLHNKHTLLRHCKSCPSSILKMILHCLRNLGWITDCHIVIT